jgi:hypothetical protein
LTRRKKRNQMMEWKREMKRRKICSQVQNNRRIQVMQVRNLKTPKRLKLEKMVKIKMARRRKQQRTTPTNRKGCSAANVKVYTRRL